MSADVGPDQVLALRRRFADPLAGGMPLQDAARAEIRRLVSDQDFQKKFLDRQHAQHEDAKAFMADLQKIAAGSGTGGA